MTLAEFNEAPHEQALAQLRACADVERWAVAVTEGRPYGSVAEALEAARTGANPWTDEEIDAALARHPRIGERAHGPGADASMSRREQSGLDPDAQVQERLRAGNVAYEERFGHVFLIRAAGRSADQILAALDERLTHTPETERRIAAEQLREIAVLRLEAILEGTS
ncbi:2-oxo-4-hydroxy-4-carboxy-5-ureidoimidazoline decarboxylase [Ornithinimicrobium faecis]|uniref:2-oxo-4-hydroxy-4-carboxy-5-ureidoimidazoline decarboxylase n=1 Tax=Ornithinimicrobium faecis TaxID=2934158 RepID=A0ABY4YV86_9MICO|nr:MULTISPECIES: 2-oxo-4-hydroxy-4-carboxy-5-ureidoimidazoline decarboxylase [unclassified Ornithinimicrobium]USQ80681.1 2-oxo-4-hydroxy-4-carboxy-5-ureidoimidazoline decarboxylase [Ornithinimicrobium sp. HY1793]